MLFRLLIVCGLVGMAVGAIAHLWTRHDARNPHKVATLQIATLTAKLRAYRLDHSRYPDTLHELATVGPPGPYARTVEFLDPWGTPFDYLPIDDGRAARIATLGEDSRVGGEGDARDIVRYAAP